MAPDDMDTQHDYVYKELEQPKKTIRLLKILSNSPQISCDLIVASLKDLPVFTTLSYCWGKMNAKEAISISGKSLEVTASLANALRDVYR
jgi:hypothetical protein